MQEFFFDQEGREIVEACACARLLHRADGVIVRRLQAALSRVCREYTLRREGMRHEKALEKMGENVAARAEALVVELNEPGKEATTDGQQG